MTLRSLPHPTGAVAACHPRHKATVSPAPNFAFRQCLLRVRDADSGGLDLSSWRIALCGGEAVSPVVMQQFTERFAGVGFNPVAFRPAYGLAESSLAVTTTIGLPFAAAGVDADVLATEGRAVEPRGTARELLSVGVAPPGAEVEIHAAPGAAGAADGVVGASARAARRHGGLFPQRRSHRRLAARRLARHR